ncbi:hypothetical protein LINPERHAP1_LOCUS14261 [Linum perenne]
MSLSMPTVNLVQRRKRCARTLLSGLLETMDCLE